MGKGKKVKVIVAMSGGVDSSVCAALLKQRGFDVSGVFMKLWKDEKEAKIYFGESSRSNPKQVLASSEIEPGEQCAEAVARKLDIPFKILDLRKEFKKRVIDCFLREFGSGRTPNPCVVCNQQIKFGLLLDKAKEMGADYVATGHYARLRREIRNPKSVNCEAITAKRFEIRNKFKIQNLKFQYNLLTAKDKTKDQSYFLYNLTQEKLRKILFPLGDYKKSEIYKLADKWQLPYKKGESVDICFVNKGGHRSFLRKYLKTKPGKIINTSGKILGQHQGLWFYTIGQRADIGGPGPFYVVKLDVKNNAVVVSNKFRDQLLYKKSLAADNVNWVLGIEPDIPLKCRARIRYGHAAVPAIVKWSSRRKSAPKKESGKTYEVIFRNHQRAITPGQSVVFYSEQNVQYIGRAARYKRNEVLGGGVIKR